MNTPPPEDPDSISLIKNMKEFMEAMERALGRARENPEKFPAWYQAFSAATTLPAFESAADLLKGIHEEADLEKLMPPEIRQRMGLLIDVLNEESFRGKIVFLFSQIDELLGQILVKRLQPRRASRVKDDELFRRMGPLDTASAKIALSYRLGLISKARANALDVLRELRNLCGHQVVPVSIDQPSIAGKVARFMELSCEASPFDIMTCIVAAGIAPANQKLFVYACLEHVLQLWGTIDMVVEVEDFHVPFATSFRKPEHGA